MGTYYWEINLNFPYTYCLVWICQKKKEDITVGVKIDPDIMHQ